MPKQVKEIATILLFRRRVRRRAQQSGYPILILYDFNNLTQYIWIATKSKRKHALLLI